MKIKIALLQLLPEKSLEEQHKKGIDACRKAKQMGADIALFPEMWSNGYNIYGRSFREWKREAISVDSDFVTGFGWKAITPIYLLTDHTDFYERYGWEFLCLVQGNDEPEMSRMYIHR